MASFVGAKLRIDGVAFARFELRIFEIEGDFFDFRRIDEDGNRFIVIDVFDDADERMPIVPTSVAVSVESIMKEDQVADRRSRRLIDEFLLKGVLVDIADGWAVVSDFLLNISTVNAIDIAHIG